MTEPPALPRRFVAALETAHERWTCRFGIASRDVLLNQLRESLAAESEATGDCDVGRISQLMKALESEHQQRFGEQGLAAELTEDRERHQARSDNTALIAYERKWQIKIHKLQRVYPERWAVAGWSEEELRDSLSLRILERLRLLDGEHLCCPGVEWGFVVARDELRALRQRNRLKAAPTDFSDCEPVLFEEDQEQRLLAHEREFQWRCAAQRAEGSLSTTQRQWYAAMRLAAVGEQFFTASKQLNLSAASRNVGKHRSSAQRAYRDLQKHFQRQLKQLD